MDPYALLCLSPAATVAEINTAFRKASLRCHPDRCPGDVAATERFNRLADARALLLRHAGSANLVSGAPVVAMVSPARQERSVCLHTAFGFSRKEGLFSAISPERLFKAPNQVLFSTTQKEASIAHEAKLSEPHRMEAAGDLQSGKRSRDEMRPNLCSAVSFAIERERERQQEVSLAKSMARANEMETERKATEQERANKDHYQKRMVQNATAKRANARSVNAQTKHVIEQRSTLEVSKENEKQTEMNTRKSQQGRPEQKRAHHQPVDDGEFDEAVVAESDTENLNNESNEFEEAFRGEDENNTVEEDAESEGGLSCTEDLVLQDEDDVEAEPAEEDKEEESTVRAAAGGLCRAASAIKRLRASSGVPPVTKRARKAGLPERLAAVLAKDISGPLEVPHAARQMLAAMVLALSPRAFEVPLPGAAQRHPFEVQVLEMIREALPGIRAAVGQMATAAICQAHAAASDSSRVRILRDALEGARKEFETQNAVVREYSATLRKYKEALAEVKQAERDLVIEAEELAQRVTASVEEHRKAEQAFATFGALEANGAPRKTTEANRMLKEVEMHMKLAKVGQTLVGSAQKALLPALRMQPVSRGKFDEAAISAAEGCFREYMQDRMEQTVGLNRETASAQEAVCRVKRNVEAAKVHCEAARDSVRCAKEELANRRIRVEAAHEACQLHKKTVTELAQAAKDHKADLMDLDDLQTVVGSLLGRPATQLRP